MKGIKLDFVEEMTFIYEKLCWTGSLVGIFLTIFTKFTLYSISMKFNKTPFKFSYVCLKRHWDP